MLVSNGEHTVMVYKILILVYVCTAFPLKCPDPAQWSMRARGHCPDPTKYFCLKNDLINAYSENCTVFDFLQPGRKSVLRGGLDATICSSERYQPWPLNFNTNVSSNCIFLKSTCNEVGQVIYNDGNRTTDTACRCDYTSGYDFLVKPRHICFCVPSEEDCSCYLKTCTDSSYKLTTDYECGDSKNNKAMSKCMPVLDGSANKTCNQSSKQHIPRQDSISTPITRTIEWIYTCTFVICIGMILVFCVTINKGKCHHKEIKQTPPPVYKREERRFLHPYKPGRNSTEKKENNDFDETDNSVTNNRNNDTAVKFGVFYSKTISHSSVSDEGICDMDESYVDVKVYIDKTHQDQLELIRKMLENGNIDGQTTCHMTVCLMEPQNKNTDKELVNKLNEDIEKLNKQLKTTGIQFISATVGSVVMCVDILVKEMETDVTFNSVLYSFMQVIVQTYKNYDSSTSNVDVAIIFPKDMPKFIKQMSVPKQEEYLQAANNNISRRYNIRVMIVGGSLEKTCLLRRLMDDPIHDAISNDVLDLRRTKCQVEVNTGKWNFRKHKDPYSICSENSDKLADCVFWEFAGQKDFCATHQTFLSANAVYLLVVDISKDFTTRIYNDMLQEKNYNIGEYTDFWLDKIHCYSTDIYGESSQVDENLELNPPVVIIVTGIEKIPLGDRKQRQQNFQDHVSRIISLQSKHRLLCKAHFLSNEYLSDNSEELGKLRKDIFDKAKTLNIWCDNQPTRWIALEKAIYRKATAKIYTMSYVEAIQLAKECKFINLKQTTSELDSFLKYEHDIGNIIFFEDVKDFIILDPNWLVDVYKCFVSEQYLSNFKNTPEWPELEGKGKLSNAVLEKLLERVPHLSLTTHKTFVLKIMEKFDIIVRSRSDQTSEVFYMPCMLKALAPKDIFRGMVKTLEIKTSWFMLEFDFLPPSYFNHILVSFVNKKRLSTTIHNQLQIYRNIGLFYMNEDHTRALLICLSQRTIAMQVLEGNRGYNCYSHLKKEVIDIVNSMKQRYPITITHTTKFKCSEGNCYKNEGRVDIGSVFDGSEYTCTEHKEQHTSEDIITSWFTKTETEEEFRKRGHRKCDDCNKITVNWCADCQKKLCKDCSITHGDSNKRHIVRKR